ncbi:MAG: hypothetical protein FJX75_21420 [Armatimonadetes bacterium]|nr:hypothetical protein [Armatimonadota bacterium]
MSDHPTPDVAGSAAAHARLGWRVLPLTVLAVLVASLLFDVGAHLIRRGQAGAGLGPIGPIYWATTIGYGVLLGVLWVLADRVLRGRWRPVGWALAFGLGALLFSPDGVVYFANAFEFGGDLALQGLQAMWPLALGSAIPGLALGWAMGRERNRMVVLLFTGFIAGMLGRGLSFGLVAGAPAMGVVALAIVRGGVQGVLLGLAAGLAVVKGSRVRGTETGDSPAS